MKKVIVVCLIVILAMSVFAACGSNSSNRTNNAEKTENSYYSWIGRFELAKIELNGSTIVKEEIEKMGGHANQYVIFQQGGTGEAALSTGSADTPLEVTDFTYTYELADEAGEMFLRDDGGSLNIRFNLKDGVLTFDLYGATMTFKKN